MPKRITDTTIDYLLNAVLPEATETYTVIPHATVIDKVRKTLSDKNFIIKREIYRCTQNANVAQGVYHIESMVDPDMGMMFAWANSYDKSLRFKCSIGAYVNHSLACIIGNNLGNFTRTHTGDADKKIDEAIEEQINNADVYFKDLVDAKELMKNITLDPLQRANVLGEMYFINELLTGEQLSIVKDELKRPSYTYTGLPDSLWSMYNAIIISLQKSHPRYWMDQQYMAHYFIMDKLVKGKLTPQELIEVTKSKLEMQASISHNQIDLEDMIEEVEAEQEEDIPCMPPPEPILQEEANHMLHGVDNNNIEALLEEPAVETETIVDEDSWPCLKCGNMQPSTAVFHDGQLCTNCSNDL